MDLKVIWTEAVVQRCSVKKVFLNISQNSQENTFARPSTRNFIKKETLVQVFSCELFEILRTPFFIEHLRWLLLFEVLSLLKSSLENLRILVVF